MITLRQLRYFRTLATVGHFGRAAEAVGISQPALSMQLREMEADLGGQLMERTATGAELTTLGSEVARRAVDILAAVHDLEAVAHSRRGVLSGPISLGVIPSVAPYLLPRLLERVAEAHPQLNLRVRETTTATLMNELAAGDLDAIVASLPLDNERLTEQPAFRDQFLLAVPEGSPHAQRKPAIAELIATEELLLLEDGHCLRDQALSVCRTVDPRRLRQLGATSLATIMQLVAAGQGVTLLPRIAVDAGAVADGRLKLIPFAQPAPYRTIGVAWRKRSPRERDFRALSAVVAAAASP
jgi:LysR family hydrogen peroxide-inducible transcriptional activator